LGAEHHLLIAVLPFIFLGAILLRARAAPGGFLPSTSPPDLSTFGTLVGEVGLAPFFFELMVDSRPGFATVGLTDDSHRL